MTSDQSPVRLDEAPPTQRAPTPTADRSPTLLDEVSTSTQAAAAAPATSTPAAPVNGEAEPLLEVRDVDLHYGRSQILFGVSLTVHPGDFVALLGTNGAGKSTVLKAISNLSPITRGQVRFDGADITGLAPDRIVAAGLGHVPGGRGALPDLTVEENLKLGGHLLRRSPALRAERIDEVVELFPWMARRRGQLAGTLSGGEQQMLAIGRALITKPKVLLVDELSLGLAPIVVEELLELLGRLNAEGTTVLVVEQHVTLAMRFARRVLFMEKGQVRFAGAAADLAARTDLLRAVYLGAT